MGTRLLALVLALTCVLLSPPAVAAGQSSPAGSSDPQVLSPDEVRQIVATSEEVRTKLSEAAGSGFYAPETFPAGTGRWIVDIRDTRDRKIVARAVVDERSRSVTDVFVGWQLEGWLVRGVEEGAFGGKLNAPYVWIPLMLAFFVPFLDRRRGFRLLYLDLLVLLAFSISHVFYNRAEIGTSFPLVYPVLGYLLVRMLVFAYSSRSGKPAAPFRPLVPAVFLALALVPLVALRIGINVANDKVIDVGYSGVIGADRLVHGEDIYGNFPRDVPTGDTYGPVNYYAYVPFELAFPWSGEWDDLPAAHAAAIFFDLATMLGLFLVGRSLLQGRRGRDLGILLAYAWAAYPYTAFALSPSSNDTLIAMLLVYAFLWLRSPPGRGALLALAGAAKFAPLAVAPLFASIEWSRAAVIKYLGAFATATIIVMLPVLAYGGLDRFWDSTFQFQLDRDSPFSIWGQESSLEPLQTLIKVLAVALAVVAVFYPRRKTPLQVAALMAAILLAVQLSLTHWFYLYIVWFFPFIMIALLGAELEEPREGWELELPHGSTEPVALLKA